MPRPGTDVALLDTPSSVSLPTDTGTAFVVGLTERGPATQPLLVTSLADFVDKYGGRQNYSFLYDWFDEFFHEGGNRAYVGRVVGPGATIGSLNLLDAGAGVSLIAKAKGPGAYSTQYKVQVTAGVAGGSYRIKVLLAADNSVLEDSGDLLDQGSAILWSQYSKYIDIFLGATPLNPAVAAATALSAGADDRASVTDAQWQTALDLFSSDLGPGQVVEPGRTSATAWGQLAAHAAAKRRVAIPDAPDTATVATLLAAAAATGKSRYMAQPFAPWIVIPGLTPGLTRAVPPSAFVCGKLANNDPGLGANRPAAGNAGISKYAIGLTQPGWNSTDRASLNSGGINVIRNVFGGIRVYGWRALVDPISDANWLDFGNMRLFMKMSAEFDQVAENFMFMELDGINGETITAFHDALIGVCQSHFEARELFGNTAEEAFFVDVGPSVNTPTTLQNLELHAVVNVKMAPFAEWVQIQVVKRQLTDSLV